MSATATTKELPILMSGEFVRAILDGRKTQTRRVVKPQPEWNGARWVWPIPKRAQRAGCSTTCVSASREWHEYMPPGCCPCGSPGDTLYVRETWRPRWTPGRGHIIRYRADGQDGPEDGSLAERIAEIYARRGSPDFDQPWRPSIHMPKWAARIWLRVTDVRVERVQEISEEDAKEEGVNGGCVACGQPDPCECRNPTPDHRDAFIYCWDTLNADRGYGWSENPWVWVVAFENATTEGGRP